jgi:hypothetical protein
MFGCVTTCVTQVLYAITNTSQVVKSPLFAGMSMHLVGQLSNPSSGLRTVLDAFPDGLRGSCGRSHGPIVPQPVMHKLGNGVVQRAVVKVLAAADQPLRRADVQAAVEELLGQSVSQDSVSWCLSAGARGKEPRFERIARGCYRLRRPI